MLKDIVIRPADKGGAIIILDNKMYMEEMARLLADNATYK